MTPEELKRKIASGLLSFPVTHFDKEVGFDDAADRQQVGWLSRHDAAALFAAGGTGRMFSLTNLTNAEVAIPSVINRRTAP